MEKNQLGIGSKINHPKFGLGVICNLSTDYYKIYFTTADELKEIARDFDNFEIVDKVLADVPPLSIEGIENALENVFLKHNTTNKSVAIASKWLGGNLIIKSKDTDLQAKEVPVSTFINKIISVREKLRVLEQNINNHGSLNESEKLHLQQYISKAYGSLTTFNVLFADKKDHFVGMSKK